MPKQKFSKGEPCPQCGQTRERYVKLAGQDVEVRCAYCDAIKGILLTQVKNLKDTL